MRLLELFQPPDGGIAEHVRLLSEGLLARGHALTVAGPAEAAPRAALEARGARYVELPLVGAVPAPGPDVRSIRALTRLLGAEPFDLVHAHGQKAGIVGRIAAARAGVPALYSPHSFVYRTQTRRAVRARRARHRLGLAMERALGRRTAMIVAVSANERDVAIDDGLVDGGHADIVLNGVEPDAAAEPDAALRAFRGEGPLLGFVAGLRDQKGLPTLLDALELLARRGTAPRFAIVGNGPLEEEVRSRVEAGPLAATTLVRSFTGRVEPYLLALDAFVLPSYWEGMPIALLEAMALGLPVVASAIDGVPEAVRDGETGYLVEPGDAEGLADRLAAIAGDAEARARMGTAARADAHRRFRLDRMIAETEALYRRVLAADGGSAG